MAVIESLLWYFLRDRRLAGHKFRRQHPIWPYVVDFVCLSARFVIELDGGQHADSGAYDNARTRYLAQRGFVVVRFWNHEVFSDTDGVVEVIREHLPARPSA